MNTLSGPPGALPEVVLRQPVLTLWEAVFTFPPG